MYFVSNLQTIKIIKKTDKKDEHITEDQSVHHRDEKTDRLSHLYIDKYRITDRQSTR